MLWTYFLNLFSTFPNFRSKKGKNYVFQTALKWEFWMQFGLLQLLTLNIGKVDIMWRLCFFSFAKGKIIKSGVQKVTSSIPTTPETHQLSEAKRLFEWRCDDCSSIFLTSRCQYINVFEFKRPDFSWSSPVVLWTLNSLY